MMTLQELSTVRRQWLDTHVPYDMLYFEDFDYKILNNIIYRARAGGAKNRKKHTINDIIIMADTETSKKPYVTVLDKDHKVTENHVVAWTISMRCYGRNLVTLYGRKPSDMARCIHNIISNMSGDETIIYFHNMSYDWTFLRQFLFAEFGLPDKQLNTKSHYPILIKWECGLTFKDSLILAQRSIAKWAKDLNVEHQKAVGCWDYDKIRTQYEVFTKDELKYIECDTLAGVECLDALRNQLHKQIYSMPYTATGIPREAVRKIAGENNGRRLFQSIVPEFSIQQMLEHVYHGGFTHANRHLIDWVITDTDTSCRDFASSYPFTMIACKMPMERFFPVGDKDINYILNNSENYAFMFKFIALNIRLKNDFIPMPALQFSKCVTSINAIQDNGRILRADYVEIYLNEMDLHIINELYDFDRYICSNCMVSKKEYLPRWFTDYVYKCFQDKTVLKDGDPVAYALAKAKLNSLYGMCVQKPVKQDIQEDYLTGEYEEVLQDPAELYDVYTKKRTSILPYQWGVWVTAYAMFNLFQLGKCVDYDHGGQWVYSDTDSIYATLWDEKKLCAYNDKCKNMMRDNGYGPAIFKGREYWLGVAEPDSVYTEFATQGAKRYCGRSKEDGKLHITVAGVPKKGAECLNDDIKNFTKGFIFPGTKTGKLTHTYYFNTDGIYIDKYGNETADSINLTPCDYRLDSVNVVSWDEVDMEEINLQVYDEEDVSGRFQFKI